MSLSDILGSAGVTLLLVAFVLNIKGFVTPINKWYLVINIIGAGLCGYSAYLINFYPFVVLELVWVLAAVWTLYKNVPRGTLKN